MAQSDEEAILVALGVGGKDARVEDLIDFPAESQTVSVSLIKSR